ncbi:DUF72 domain-containing protein [Leptolyngbya sp. AN02str]|uniref:DUF72 domain-containing protein n=1 Tax=Leptolyngbya sp. AN02str TaxID=3423363 RepID=UPI003D3234A1
MEFRLGLAIWGYKDWVGEMFPAKTRSADFLKLYGQRFFAVEGNTTFYSVPDAETVQRWASEVPDGFKFCPKLPRTVTHQGKLMDHVPEAIAFLERMEGLGDRLGPIFAQLPPSYGPEYLEDLTAFVQAWPHERAQLAVEVRHFDWFLGSEATELTLLLSNAGVGRVVLDTRPIYECPDDPQLTSERKKPRVPVNRIATADFCLVRYISHPEVEWNATYFEEWVTQVSAWLAQGKQVYFFVHCPVEARSPDNARHFQALLEQQSPLVPPLPWDQLDPEPFQLRLF